MPNKFRDKALVLAIAGAALVAGYFAYSLPRADAPDVTALMNANFSNLDGTTSKISDWDGKLRVVNFWATWCAPCREEIPGFVRLQDQYRDKGIVFVGVALDNEKAVRRFVAETGMNYPVLLAEYSAIDLAKSAGNQLSALPFTVLIARDGSYAHAFSGVVNEEQLKIAITRFL